MLYPTFEELHTTPDFLRIGASAMAQLRAFGWLEERRALPPAMLEKRPHAPRAVHRFASQYVGVCAHRGQFVARWTIDGKLHHGRVRACEKWAAQDRARGLGREYVERRDGVRIPYLWKPEELDDAA